MGIRQETEAKDIRAVVTTLGFDKTSVVAHDNGNMVAYAYAAMCFAETGDEPVVVQITGFGPSSTEYVDKTQDPRLRKP